MGHYFLDIQYVQCAYTIKKPPLGVVWDGVKHLTKLNKRSFLAMFDYCSSFSMWGQRICILGTFKPGSRSDFFLHVRVVFHQRVQRLILCSFHAEDLIFYCVY